MNASDQFRDAIRASGLTPPEAIDADGAIHRFACNGKKKDDAGWYVFHSDGIAAGSFGSWRTGISQSWRADIGRALTPAEDAAHRERIKAAQAAREAEEAKRHAAAARKAAALWKEAKAAAPDHPYLQRKQVAPVATLREIDCDRATEILGYAPQARGEALTGRLLVAPIKIGDALSTCELIDEAGRKSAIAGGAKRAGYWCAQALPEGDGSGVTLLIGEGVVTVLSAQVATGHPGIAALSCGNLAAVARVMRERYPKARIVILSDLGNGEHDAEQAARECGGLLAVPDFGNDRPEGATDFNDLAAQRGPEAVDRAIASATAPDGSTHQPGAGNAAEGLDWPQPQPLAAKIAAEPYPLDALPATIRAAVGEVGAFVQAPVAMVAASAFAALSLAAQAQIDVKRAERLQGPCGLFLLTIADSGERKSTCDGFFLSAIHAYEAEQALAAKPELARHAAEFAAWAAQREGVLQAIKQAGKTGKPVDRLRTDLAQMETDKPEPPRIPRLLYADATPEALAWNLAHSWPSGGVISAEAGLVFGAHAMGRDSIMRNLAMLNQLWDGNALPVDRRTSESFVVRGARLTVALQVQEPTLRSFFDRSGGLARGSGFLARFLLAWPESTQGNRPFTEAPAHWPHLAAFHRRIAAILANPVAMNEAGALTPPALMLAPEAKAAWIAFHDAIESELRSGGELYDVRDVASKTADNAVRLAALFQLFEHGIGGAVGLESFEGASRITAWHLNESRRFFGELALPVEQANAVRLDDWLAGHCRRERAHLVGKRYALQHGPLRNDAALLAALRELDDLDRARLRKEGRRMWIAVNPALLSAHQP